MAGTVGGYVTLVLENRTIPPAGLRRVQTLLTPLANRPGVLWRLRGVVTSLEPRLAFTPPPQGQFSAGIADLVAVRKGGSPDQRSGRHRASWQKIQIRDRTIIAVRPQPVGLPTSGSHFAALRPWSGRRVSNSSWDRDPPIRDWRKASA
jgi:hypothetical protein